MGFQIVFALSIFIAVFVFVATETVNKSIAALLGASLFLVLKIIDQKSAFEYIDWNVIFLLISMMIIVGITKKTGLFEYIAIRAAKIARGEPIRIMLSFAVITAVVSAFLDNVTTVMILTPICILIARELELSPNPFVISAAMASNIGGTATLIGDPPNIMIGSAANLSFMDFVINLSPIVIINMLVFLVIIYFIWHKKMWVSNQLKARIMDFDEKRSIHNKAMLFRAIAVLGLVIIGFLLHGYFGLEPATVGLGGASILMIITNRKTVEEFFHEVEWETIFFFIGLFIIVGGLVHLGIIEKLARAIMGLTKGNIPVTAVAIIWISGIFSSFLDNIPFVATMVPLIRDIGNTVGADKILPLWWALSLGACLGGNGTLIGASANVVSAGISGRSGHRISFMEFTKYGAGITVVTLLISTVLLWVFFL
ncbi:MAG: ArsB/NhaD family transporter [Candidatus Neomarinimicrobiota bacterium]